MDTTLFDRIRFEQIKATGALPSPKDAALRIIRLTQSDRASLADLDKAVRADPAFVARLIKAANAVNARERRPVVSVRDALAVMGISAVRGLALGFSLLSAHRNGHCRHFDYGRFWSHSLVVALAFQAISRHTRAAELDEAFSVGLLARIGELALASLYPEQYEQFMARAVVLHDLPLAAAERAQLGLTHNELTAALLTEWGFPAVYVEPVFFHENADQSGFPEGSRSDALARSLAMARHIADICLSPAEGRVALMGRLQLLGSRLGLDGDTLSQLCDSVTAQWSDWAPLLSVRSETVPPFDTLAAAASAVTTEPEPGTGSRLRVLIVEDDRTTRLLLKAIVEAAGYEVMDAENGEQGLNLALDRVPDMVITDWVMAGMSGIDLVRALRRTRSGQEMYLIVLTTLDDEETLVQAFDAGVDDFIQKPLRPRTISARLRAGQRMVTMQRTNSQDQAELHRVAGELAVANRQLQELAITDALTGFPNRRYAMERLAQEWATAARRHSSLSCMVLDLDYFKQINDCHGHDVGDQAMARVAAAIKSSIRVQDAICRIGGDEFLAICPDANLEAALACGERIRRAVEALAIPAGEHTCTLSIGVAQRTADIQKPEDLLKRADEGVYLAKRRGRNQVASI